MAGASVPQSVAVLLGNIGAAIVIALLGLRFQSQKPVT